MPDARLGHPVDMAITYRPLSTKMGPADPAGGEKILADRCRLVLAPGLLRASGYRNRKDIGAVPALISTDSNWDWALWARSFDIPIGGMQFADQFDIDDAALHGAVAGLGMVLAPAIMITGNLRQARLLCCSMSSRLNWGPIFCTPAHILACAAAASSKRPANG